MMQGRELGREQGCYPDGCRQRSDRSAALRAVPKPKIPPKRCTCADRTTSTQHGDWSTPMVCSRQNPAKRHGTRAIHPSRVKNELVPQMRRLKHEPKHFLVNSITNYMTQCIFNCIIHTNMRQKSQCHNDVIMSSTIFCRKIFTVSHEAVGEKKKHKSKLQPDRCVHRPTPPSEE
ncbi:hypothetical protein WN51_14704 [Melipona quadrifasciata]|uniref:Uncharacterized protein n=1 Tax=Melipona quadrifasciata TaxID=166423 RepID=A0A0M9A1Z6_9HYME|nr:hypothetical protein WN51_14704 [Melipona quadrifasciata]